MSSPHPAAGSKSPMSLLRRLSSPSPTIHPYSSGSFDSQSPSADPFDFDFESDSSNLFDGKRFRRHSSGSGTSTPTLDPLGSPPSLSPKQSKRSTSTIPITPPTPAVAILKPWPSLAARNSPFALLKPFSVHLKPNPPPLSTTTLYCTTRTQSLPSAISAMPPTLVQEVTVVVDRDVTKVLYEFMSLESPAQCLVPDIAAATSAAATGTNTAPTTTLSGGPNNSSCAPAPTPVSAPVQTKILTTGFRTGTNIPVATSLLVYFVRPVVITKTTSGKPILKNVEYHLCLSYETGFGGAEIVTFETVTPDILAKADSDYQRRMAFKCRNPCVVKGNVVFEEGQVPNTTNLTISGAIEGRVTRDVPSKSRTSMHSQRESSLGAERSESGRFSGRSHASSGSIYSSKERSRRSGSRNSSRPGTTSVVREVTQESIDKRDHGKDAFPILAALTNSVERARLKFEDKISVDSDRIDATIGMIGDENDISPNETMAISRAVTLLEDCMLSPQWKGTRVPNTVHEPVQYFSHVNQDGYWGRASAEFDEGAATVFAHVWNTMSYRNLDEYIAQQGMLLKAEIDVDHSRSKTTIQSIKFPLGFVNRTVTNWWCWSRSTDPQTDEDSFYIVISPLDEYTDDPMSVDKIVEMRNENVDASKSIAGSLKAVYKITPISDNICQMDYFMCGHGGGNCPEFVSNATWWDHLKSFDNLREKLMRNPAVVDAEIQAALPRPPPLSSIAPDLMKMFERCTELEGGSTNTNPNLMKNAQSLRGSPKSAVGFGKSLSGGRVHSDVKKQMSQAKTNSQQKHSRYQWHPIPSTSYHTKWFVRHIPVASGERDVACGRAVTLVDASAVDAVKWWFIYASRFRKKASAEAGNPIRFKIREFSPHDCEFVTVKKIGRLLSPREIKFRAVVVEDTGWTSNGDFIWFAESTPETEIDYGKKMKLVKAKMTCVVRFTPVEGKEGFQCKVTVSQQLDVGSIPAWMVFRMVPRSLRALDELRVKYQQDLRVDKIEQDELAKKILAEKKQDISTEDMNSMSVIAAVLNSVVGRKLDPLVSPDPLVNMSRIHEAGGKEGYMSATTVVDSTIADCVAWEISKFKRSDTKSSSSADRKIIVHSTHKSTYRMTVNVGVPGFLPREFVMNQLWKWDDEDQTKLTIAYGPSDHDQFPPHPLRHVRAQSWYRWTFEKLSPVGDVPQTSVKYEMMLNFGGSIPAFLVSSGAVKQLAYLTKMRRFFDRALETDLWQRSLTVKQIKMHNPVLTKEESEVLDEGQRRLLDFEADPKKKAFKAKELFPVTSYTVPVRGSEVQGRSDVEVRATKEEVLAYLWNWTAKSSWTDCDLDRSVLEEENEHHHTTYMLTKGFKRSRPREQVSRAVWKKMTKDSIMFASSAVAHADSAYKTMGGRKRVHDDAVAIIREIRPLVCKISYLTNLDLSSVPSKVATNFYFRRHFALVFKMHIDFHGLRDLDDYDDYDGHVIALQLIFATRETMNKKGGRGGGLLDAVDKIIEKNRGLKQLGLEHTWLRVFLAEVIKGTLQLNRPVATKLECLTVGEAKKIGSSLAQALRQRKFAEAGIYQWKMQSPCLVELFKRHPFMDSMILTISKHVLGNAMWGVVFRVMTGAGLRIIHMFSDIRMSIEYLGDPERETYGYLLLGMVGMSIFWSLIIVFAQNRKNPKALLMETLYVITGVKAGVDAMRVAHGDKQGLHQIMDPKAEMNIIKSAVVAMESIPGCVLQVYAYMHLLQGSEKSTLGLLGIFVSAASAGFTSASISYDIDSDPSKRSANPSFYGYIPDRAKLRTLMFLTLMFKSGTLLLIRSVGAAFLMKVNVNYLVYYHAADISLYMVQKGLRGDFFYYLPLYGPLGILTNLVFMAVSKILCDYSGILHLRNAPEMGGVYWSANIVLAMAASYGATILYFERTPEDKVVVYEHNAWLGLGVLTGFWIALFGLFLSLMKKGYRKSFFDTTTGKQYCQRQFVEGKSDERKANILKRNSNLWLKDLGGEVEKWVREGWWRWNEEKPAWLTENIKARIPIQWVPIESRREVTRGRSDGRRRRGRRMSFSNMLENVGDGGRQEDEEAEEKKGIEKAVGANAIMAERRASMAARIRRDKTEKEEAQGKEDGEGGGGSSLRLLPKEDGASVASGSESRGSNNSKRCRENESGGSAGVDSVVNSALEGFDHLASFLTAQAEKEETEQRVSENRESEQMVSENRESEQREEEKRKGGE